MTIRSIQRIAVIGTGIMGAGIAQIAAQSGHEVHLFDAREGAAETARNGLGKTFEKLVDKGKITPDAMQAAMSHLKIAHSLQDVAGCDLVIEAIVENLDIKRELLKQLEALLTNDAIIATNTSSLSVTAIAANCEHPERVAGFHFFNPVPLMRIVEVIDGIATAPDISDALLALAKKMGHTGVRAKDTPGFIVNHAGRAYGTEALRILGEGVGSIGDIDRILRDGAGFRMGPFELLDLTGLDVSHPVMESIYHQFYEEPRYRPHPLTRQMLSGNRLGRKTNQGFYRYEQGKMLNPAAPQPVPSVDRIPPVWVGCENEADRQTLHALLGTLNATVEQGGEPSEKAICLLAPLGEDVTAAAQRFGCDPARSIGIDLFSDPAKHRCLVLSLVTRSDIRDAAHALMANDGVGVTVVRDSVGFVAQRTLAMVVNLGCDIAQQQIATVEDINQAVRLGLGYPFGPLTWGDHLGADKIMTILQRMTELTGDPRYRPSPWLRRRTQLGLSLNYEEPEITA